MKKKLYIWLTALIIFIGAFALSVSLFFDLGNSFEITFAADKDVFSGISVDVEVFNESDAYSLCATLSAGEAAKATLKYDDSYYDHYHFPHEHESDADGLDLSYINVRKLVLAKDRSILLYRVFDGVPIVVSEDGEKRVYIQTYDKNVKTLIDICDVYIENRSNDTPAIDYSNGIACVKVSSRLSFKEGEYWMDYSYRAVDMKGHSLAAYGDVADKIFDRVDFIFSPAFTVQEIFDILWRDGILYIVDNANCKTAEYGDISAVPVISAITENGPLAMGEPLFTSNFAPSESQYIKVSFTNTKGGE